MTDVVFDNLTTTAGAEIQIPQRIPEVGDLVFFTLPDGPNKGQDRPAIIVRRWGSTIGAAVQLQVFTDGGNDGPAYASGLFWATSVMQAKTAGELRAYHYGSRA